MLIGKGVERLLVSSTVQGGLVIPKGSAENNKEVGETVACATPVPASATVCGLLGAPSVTVRVPASPPMREGVYVTEKVHVLRAGTLLPQGMVWAKSPLVVTLEIPRAVLCALVKVTVCGALGVFSA